MIRALLFPALLLAGLGLGGCVAYGPGYGYYGPAVVGPSVYVAPRPYYGRWGGRRW